MILGIVSIPLNLLAPFGGAGGLAAIVLGILGLRGTREGVASDRGMAWTGIICGAISVVLPVLLFAVLPD
jgi:hypothetical protein